MKGQAMFESILDNDLYKFTMQQAVHMLYPRAEASYGLVNRGNTPFPYGFREQLSARVEKMSDLKLTDDEKQYLSDTCYFLTPVYLDFLESYRFDPQEVTIKQNGMELKVDVEGPWYKTILWEVPLLAAISELFFKTTGAESISPQKSTAVNQRKAKELKRQGIEFADFGTRRRFSYETQEALLRDILKVEGNTLVGTSNVNFSKKFKITPIGTQAHEWFMFHAVINGYRMANSAAVNAWTRAYQGDLGIALTDTFTTDVFLATFDTVQAKLFDGVRQDSGDPQAFVDKVVAHYEKLHIDPRTKTVVFSDGLDVQKAIAIHNYCKGRIKDSYGIGTNLTNDVGVTPLNIVIKLMKCRETGIRDWQFVAKLSDSEDKYTGDSEEIAHCIKVLQRGK